MAPTTTTTTLRTTTLSTIPTTNTPMPQCNITIKEPNSQNFIQDFNYKMMNSMDKLMDNQFSNNEYKEMLLGASLDVNNQEVANIQTRLERIQNMMRSIDTSNNKDFSFNNVANSAKLHLSPVNDVNDVNDVNIKYLINLLSNCKSNIIKGCLTNINNGKNIKLETCTGNNPNQHFVFKKISCDNDRKNVYKEAPSEHQIILFPNLVPYPYFIIIPNENKSSHMCVTIEQYENKFNLRIMPFRGLETQCFNMIKSNHNIS